MKKTRFMEMQQQMVTRYGEQQGTAIAEAMAAEFQQLSADFQDRPQSLQKHLHNNIFPVVTAFHALMAQGLNREEASRSAQSAFLALMDPIADTIRKALKVPGLHRLIPWVFKTEMPKLFSEEAGFQFHIYPTDRHRARFDMEACPYYTICKELDCLDIAPVFCATDDACYGNMHPNLIWNRTKTIARGGDLCDFDLQLKQKD